MNGKVQKLTYIVNIVSRIAFGVMLTIRVSISNLIYHFIYSVILLIQSLTFNLNFILKIHQRKQHAKNVISHGVL